MTLSSEQITNTAANPPHRTAVGGTYETRLKDQTYEFRGVALPDMVRHDEQGRLAVVTTESMQKLFWLAQ